jgi:hypothetical protein
MSDHVFHLSGHVTRSDNGQGVFGLRVEARNPDDADAWARKWAKRRSRQVTPRVSAATDGATAIQFRGCSKATPNCLPVSQGWNFMVRPRVTAGLRP